MSWLHVQHIRQIVGVCVVGGVVPGFLNLGTEGRCHLRGDDLRDNYALVFGIADRVILQIENDRVLQPVGLDRLQAVAGLLCCVLGGERVGEPVYAEGNAQPVAFCGAAGELLVDVVFAVACAGDDELYARSLDLLKVRRTLPCCCTSFLLQATGAGTTLI